MARSVLSYRTPDSIHSEKEVEFHPLPRSAAWVLWGFILFGIGNILWLNSCQTTEGHTQTVHESFHHADGQTFQSMPNEGLFTTSFDQEHIRVSLNTSGTHYPVAVRLYDTMGRLVYIEKDPFPNPYTDLGIDCRYMDKGQYLLLVYLDNGHMVEDWVNIF
ncbi:MAG: hypothetical protein AAF135_22510 [Bacteroidota bacterium]